MMETHKNISTDVAGALSPFGIGSFLVLGLQEVPGSGEQRGVWALSVKDRKVFVEGLIKLFLDHDELVRLFITVLYAGGIYQRLAEVEALISKKEGQA